MNDVARKSEQIVSAMEKISVTHDAGLDGAFPAAWPARVRISTAAGTFENEVRNPPGHPDRPLDMTVTVDRFRAYSGDRLSPGAQDAIIDAVRDLATLPDMSPLIAPIRAIV